MTQAEQAEPPKLSVWTKFVYGLGSASEMVTLAAVGGYAMFFYNQVVGLPATLAGLAITVSLVLDGMAEPLVGSLSDRMRSRWGRRHPFMFVGVIPVAICVVAIFNPPKDLAHIWLFLWFASFVVTLRIFMAVCHVPHMALGGELAQGYTERSRVMAWNNLLGMIGRASTSFIALSLFFHATEEYPRGLLNPHAYTPFALSVAAAGLILLMISAWFTRHRIPYLPKPPQDLPPFSPFEFFRDMKGAFSNINYVWLLVGFFFLSLMLGVREGLNLYINTFFWGFTSEQIRWFVIGTLTGFFVGFFLTAPIHARFDKKIAVLVAGAFLAVTPAVPIVLQLNDLMPPADDARLLPMVIAFAGVSAAAGSVMNISVMSQLADIADENELRFGYRQEGVLYSTRSFFAKLDTAIGHLFAGIALDLVAFPERATPGQVPEETLRALAFVDGPVAAIPGLIALLFYARYRITRASYEATRTRLLDARAARGGRMAAAPSD
jgi:Na+/melibiose symporter-like transporter